MYVGQGDFENDCTSAFIMMKIDTRIGCPIDILAVISGILAVSTREARPILESDMGDSQASNLWLRYK